MNLKEKLTSRKFWICVASFLASTATSVAGLKTDNDAIATIGIVCAVVSAAIFAACEAAVDAAAAGTDLIVEDGIEVESEEK